jgi:hypothetical protein
MKMRGQRKKALEIRIVALEVMVNTPLERRSRRHNRHKLPTPAPP